MFINLMPWRQQKRARNRRLFLQMVTSGLIISLGINLAIYLSLWPKRNHLLAELAQLSNSLSEVTKTLRHLQETVNITEPNKLLWVVVLNFFLKFPEVATHSIQLLEARFSNHQIEINGLAVNMEAVFQLVAELRANNSLKNFNLLNLQQKENKYYFELHNELSGDN